MGIWKIDDSIDTSLKNRVREQIAVRFLLKELLDGQETPIAHYADGAPYLPNRPEHISISHTKGYAAVLLSETTHPGIDIEYASDRIHRIAPRFLSEKELTQIGTPPSTAQLQLYWTAKETLFKMIREEGIDFRAQFYIHPVANMPKGKLQADYINTIDEKAVFELSYEITPEFVLCFGW